ncbi:CPBP family intramembrane glutamic endopeptidase [Halobellus rubicundus]|uniref:CPBP family intramembrane glutamic endopeptidase n=1 Tax=Halobellus rubicundus TaxID=2996466 RepID=A0ABD5MEA3_9EURY
MSPPTLASLRIPGDRLRRTAGAFETVGSAWALAAVAPIALTALVITAGYVAAGGADPGFPPHFPTLVYGVANLAVVGGLFVALDSAPFAAAALFRTPSRREIAAGAVATALGVFVGWPATTMLADALGVARYAPATVTTAAGALAVGFGAVVVAPVAEELLYRGLLVGVGIERGYRPLVVGAASLTVFAVVHVFTAGIAGVLNAALLGSLLTWLRLRFDNLVGAWLFHALNNLLELLVGLSLLPSLYAL